MYDLYLFELILSLNELKNYYKPTYQPILNYQENLVGPRENYRRSKTGIRRDFQPLSEYYNYLRNKSFVFSKPTNLKDKFKEMFSLESYTLPTLDVGDRGDHMRKLWHKLNTFRSPTFV